MDSTQPRLRIPARGPDRPCKITDCQRTVGRKGARGFCSRHYQRLLSTGSPTGTRRPTPESRFFAKVVEHDGCWVWTAAKDDSGYGMFCDVTSPSKSTHTRIERAHRWCYSFLRAEIPEGLQLDHLCRRRDCVNPWHLEPVTNLVNWERGISPWRLNDLKECCPQGHSYSLDNTYVNPAGSRVCRRCMAKHRQAYQERQAKKTRKVA